MSKKLSIGRRGAKWEEFRDFRKATGSLNLAEEFPGFILIESERPKGADCYVELWVSPHSPRVSDTEGRSSHLEEIAEQLKEARTQYKTLVEQHQWILDHPDQVYPDAIEQSLFDLESAKAHGLELRAIAERLHAELANSEEQDFVGCLNRDEFGPGEPIGTITDQTHLTTGNRPNNIGILYKSLDTARYGYIEAANNGDSATALAQAQKAFKIFAEMAKTVGGIQNDDITGALINSDEDADTEEYESGGIDKCQRWRSGIIQHAYNRRAAYSNFRWWLDAVQNTAQQKATRAARYNKIQAIFRTRQVEPYALIALGEPERKMKARQRLHDILGQPLLEVEKGLVELYWKAERDGDARLMEICQACSAVLALRS